MNRYEISISNTLGHESTYLGMWTVHAGTPRVAMQRVMENIGRPGVFLAVNNMISLKFDVVNQGKVIRIADVRWHDFQGDMVTMTNDGIRYYTRDDNDECQVEYKNYGYREEYILKGERIPEGWEVYKRNEPTQFRFKPTARLAVLSVDYLANKEG